MFETLSDKLQRSFKNLRGQGTITDENIADAMTEIRLALIESDVNLSVVETLVEHIRVKAIGTQVTTALSPSEQIAKIVHDELIAILGKDISKFRTASQPPSVVLMAGLQGSGKTTTSAKLAQWLKKGGTACIRAGCFFRCCPSRWACSPGASPFINATRASSS